MRLEADDGCEQELVRTLLLILAAALAGCATTPVVGPPRGGVESGVALAASAGPARTTSGSRTQTRGLPLSRGAKIGLWAGVAVFLAYLMADSERDTDAAADDGP
jgi:hypothetical protein